MKNIFLSILAATLPTILYADTNPQFIGEDFSGRPCVGSIGSYGPFDYTKRVNYPKELYLVESAHFTTNVETLVKGSTSSLPYGDLAYTLRAWPNHHRALNSISRYHLKFKRIGKSIPISAECWFQRAINYSPNDATTYMLYGMYLHNSKKLKQADANYQTALRLDPDNIQSHYNYGLLLVAQKKFSEAKKHAEIAYAQSYPLQGLRNKLKAAGQWPNK
ncbi:tetratricopeptide repeat protein [Sedimenticola selenatireducens]|nr:tetratricopeptide repeat protein [Sedimenticola selenatireducens]